jgi:hypothetical protein
MDACASEMDLGSTRRRAALVVLSAGCGLALSAILSPSAVAQQKRAPFSEAEVIEALRGDIPPKHLEALVRQYGVAFELTPQVEAGLRQVGATDALLKAVRESFRAPPPPPQGALLIKSTPGGAQVYVNDKPMGVTGANGELCVRPLSPGEYKVKVTLAGYQDYAQTVSVEAGQPLIVTTILTTLQKHLVGKFRVTHQHLIGSCEGDLIIGHGMLQYHADHQGPHAFESPLSNITYGTYSIGGGFYVLLKGEKQRRQFHSKSELEILQILAYHADYQ